MWRWWASMWPAPREGRGGGGRREPPRRALKRQRPEGAAARGRAPRGLTVKAVAPGFIGRAMTEKMSGEVRAALLTKIPLGRLGAPDDVAEAVGLLVSPAAAYITGHVLHVNGGMIMV